MNNWKTTKNEVTAFFFFFFSKLTDGHLLEAGISKKNDKKNQIG